MQIQKYNAKTKKYEKRLISDDWHISYYETDMQAKINCACCGKIISYCDGYTSRQLHTSCGFGYSVCEKCYEAEWEEEKDLHTDCFAYAGKGNCTALNSQDCAWCSFYKTQQQYDEGLARAAERISLKNKKVVIF